MFKMYIINIKAYYAHFYGTYVKLQGLRYCFKGSDIL